METHQMSHIFPEPVAVLLSRFIQLPKCCSFKYVDRWIFNEMRAYAQWDRLPPISRY